MEHKRRVVMADVAAVAGVSTQTVSRVLNGSAGVDRRKAERVRNAAQTLGYEPNLAARALASSRSGVIGVLIAARAYAGVVDLLMAVEAAARLEGYYVVIATEEDPRPELVRDAFRHLQRRQVESVVVLAQASDVVPALLSVRKQTPTVLVLAGQRDLEGVSTLAIEQVDGGRMATEHLFACGYRDVLHLTGDLLWQDAGDRLTGYRAACAEQGVEAKVFEGRSWDSAEGFRAGRAILAQGAPRAIFAGNDALALGLFTAIAQAGLRIPEDIAVIGFDDVAGAPWYAPSLSSVRQDYTAIGSHAMGLVADLLADNERQDVRLDPVVIGRASTLGAAKFIQ